MKGIINKGIEEFGIKKYGEGISKHKIHIHYFSKRKLCTVLRGLIQEVGLYFDQLLQVQEVACVYRGDPHCIMEVTFNEEK